MHSDQGSNPQPRYVPWLEILQPFSYGTMLQSTELNGPGRNIRFKGASPNKLLMSPLGLLLLEKAQWEAAEGLLLTFKTPVHI